MGFIGYLIALLLTGLVVGAFARLALPGKDPMTIPQTIAVGVGGSFLAGVAAELLVGRAAGFLLCLIFAAGIVYFIRRSRGGGLTSPGATPLDR
ncbi:MAG: GlsB/YeaQ/YmgE family stress response membrane protein [Solirubrobacteraceae bacterium]